MLDGISKFRSELKKTNDLLSKRISYKRTFFLGIIHGLGSALGATIIAGILLAMLLRFFQSFDKLEIIDQYIKTDTIQNQLPHNN